mmetsp:Transcript_15024/g.17896  ORF Transcript_15024/g.17896 Transcript_15024/m.17896 type:complete len:245 (-) Transcript_15024:4-738(-)
MLVNQVIATTSDGRVLILLDSDDQVTWQLIIRLVTLTNEAQDSAGVHTRLDLNLFFDRDRLHGSAITLSDLPMKRDQLRATIEEFEERAIPRDFQVSSVCFFPRGHCLLVQITLDTLDHFDLFAGLVECDSVRVGGAEENLEHFKGVAVESIAGDLMVAVKVAIFERFFPVAIVSFSQLRRRQHFESFTDLAELVISLCHRFLVFERVVGDGEDAEVACDVLIAGIGAHTESLIVVFAHLFDVD